MRLNDAQQRLVVDNRRLVYAAVNRLLRRGDVRALGRDEAEGVGLLALARAAYYYDPAIAKFSTYAFKAITVSVLQAAEQWMKGAAPVSLDVALVPGEPETLAAVVPARPAPDPVTRLDVHALLARLPERQRAALVGYVGLDRTGREVGADLGVSHQAVSQLAATAAENLRAVASQEDGH